MNVKQNVFQIWRENGEKLPFKVIIDSWNPDKHYAVIEKIEIGTWPYGAAYGQYFFNGKAGERGKIRNAGTGRWVLKIEI